MLKKIMIGGCLAASMASAAHAPSVDWCIRAGTWLQAEAPKRIGRVAADSSKEAWAARHEVNDVWFQWGGSLGACYQKYGSGSPTMSRVP